jgi:hypothetical protein
MNQLALVLFISDVCSDGSGGFENPPKKLYWGFHRHHHLSVGLQGLL